MHTFLHVFFSPSSCLTNLPTLSLCLQHFSPLITSISPLSLSLSLSLSCPFSFAAPRLLLLFLSLNNGVKVSTTLPVRWKIFISLPLCPSSPCHWQLHFTAQSQFLSRDLSLISTSSSLMDMQRSPLSLVFLCLPRTRDERFASLTVTCKYSWYQVGKWAKKHQILSSFSLSSPLLVFLSLSASYSTSHVSHQASCSCLLMQQTRLPVNHITSMVTCSCLTLLVHLCVSQCVSEVWVSLPLCVCVLSCAHSTLPACFLSLITSHNSQCDAFTLPSPLSLLSPLLSLPLHMNGICIAWKKLSVSWNNELIKLTRSLCVCVSVCSPFSDFIDRPHRSQEHTMHLTVCPCASACLPLALLPWLLMHLFSLLASSSSGTLAFLFIQLDIKSIILSRWRFVSSRLVSSRLDSTWLVHRPVNNWWAKYFTPSCMHQLLIASFLFLPHWWAFFHSCETRPPPLSPRTSQITSLACVNACDFSVHCIRCM